MKVQFTVVALFVCLAGCSGGSDGHRPPPSESSLALVISDRPDATFGGRGDVTIMPGAGAVTTRMIQFQVVTSNEGETIVVGGQLSDDEATALAGHQPVVAPANMTVTYQDGADTDANDRRVASMTLEFPDRSMELTLELEQLTHAGTPVAGPASADATLTGVLPLACADRDETGSVIADPRWESAFCSGTRAELHLEAWIEAL